MGWFTGPPRTRRLLIMAASGLVAGIAALAGIAACAVKDHYETLSFFFDGVPNPALASSGTEGGVVNLRASPTYSIHRPYADEACGQCHGETLRRDAGTGQLCLKCHEGVPSQFPRMHGPVAVGACIWCHDPHESAQSHLLKKPARELCSKCHSFALLRTAAVPDHVSTATRSCLDCHAGHGGDKMFFLRPEGPAPESTAKPATRSGPGIEVPPPEAPAKPEPAPAPKPAPPGGAS